MVAALPLMNHKNPSGVLLDLARSSAVVLPVLLVSKVFLRISRQAYRQVVVPILSRTSQVALSTRGARQALAYPILHRLHFGTFNHRGARQDLAYPKITHYRASGFQQRSSQQRQAAKGTKRAVSCPPLRCPAPHHQQPQSHGLIGRSYPQGWTRPVPPVQNSETRP